ncbi:MAG TPA: enolase C-terminal domain-like protein [Patescibacteria group bacterium]|nr:enolase C-terminal domain-like protein [Patescibacteria group bacterium]
MVIREQPPIGATANEILNAPLEVAAAYAQAVELSLTEPMTLSFGTFPSRPSGWLSLVCEVNGESAVGYGEGATLPQPVFTEDCGGNIAGNMSELVHAIVDSPETTVNGALQAIQEHRFADGKHYPTARLATEMAVLDAGTKAYQTSVKELIGVPDGIAEVPYGKSIGGASKSDILRQAEEALGNNARKIKIKVSPGLFGDVMCAIDTLKQEHPGIDIMVDANGGFDPANADHLVMLKGLDGQGLIMIEEPVSRVGSMRGLDAVRALRRSLPHLSTAICLDDCLQTQQDCQTALEEGLAEVINIKPGRIGSFMRSLDLADLAVAKGAEVMVGGMLEGTPGRCMTTLLGAYCLYRGFTVPGDLSLAQERLASDLVNTDKQLKLSPNGGIILPSGLGWGF